jgi:hypothetical protein
VDKLINGGIVKASELGQISSSARKKLRLPRRRWPEQQRQAQTQGS